MQSEIVYFLVDFIIVHWSLIMHQSLIKLMNESFNIVHDDWAVTSMVTLLYLRYFKGTVFVNFYFSVSPVLSLSYP